MAEARFLASREARWRGSTSTSTSTSTHDHDSRGEGSGDVSLGRSPGQGEEVGDDGPRRNDGDNDNVLAAVGPRRGGLSPSPPKLPLAAPPQARKKFSFVKYREFVARAGRQQPLQSTTTTTTYSTSSKFQLTEGSLTDLVEEKDELGGATRRGGNPRGIKDQNNAEAVEAEAEAAMVPDSSSSSYLASSSSYLASSSSSSSSSPSRNDGTTCRAEHLVSVHVVLDGRGHVVRTSAPRRGNDEDDDDDDIISPFEDPATASWTTPESHEGEPSYPAVIRDVDHSVVELCGRLYPSIHLMKVRHSTIHMWHGAPRGAIHVTDCQYTHVHVNGPVQQLRIHDSTHLNVHLATVTGGIILENCTAITFYVEDDDNDNDGTSGGTPSLLDVKDFSFLKRGVPSPNYTVRRAVPCNGDSQRPHDPRDRHVEGAKGTTPAKSDNALHHDDGDEDDDEI